MDTSPVNLPTHEHPLHRSFRFIHDYCDGCFKKGPIQEGYRCNDSKCSHVWLHKECAEAPPTLLNHSFRLQHSLILTHFTDQSSRCDLCGKYLKSYRNCERYSTSGYRCLKCDFKVDLVCTIKPQPLVIAYPMFHDHLLALIDRFSYGTRCGACKGWIISNEYPYGCYKCSVNFHVECVTLAPEVDHPFHSKHPLMLLKSESLSAHGSKTCVLCGAESEALLYHCAICNFSVCVFCTTSPPRLAIKHGKTHEHELSLMPSKISFTCNACGMIDNQSPYLCLQCGFSFHRGCVDLPRVININRHDHRISLVHQLGPGYSSCGVCHKNVDQYYGGYACSLCPTYAVHSQCAVRNDIWEGIELENIPEEIEDIAPFIKVGDNLIKHFSHEEHYLRFNNNTIFHDESTRCKACVCPVYSNPVYECEQCDFILHEKCANLPRKKRLVYSSKPFTLFTTNEDLGHHFKCSSCGIISSGFRYVSGHLNLDTFCGVFSEPFMHDGHLHPLYYDSNYDRTSKCSVCLKVIQGSRLHCNTCAFSLHFRCANMPKSVKSKHDDHVLVLCYGETANGIYWCDICEEETDPAKWFYTCSDCGVTLHVECVLGDFSHLMPGCVIEEVGERLEVVSSNLKSCRPFCTTCKTRCKVPYILKSCDEDNKYVCSKKCLSLRDGGRKLTLEDFLVMASVVGPG